MEVKMVELGLFRLPGIVIEENEDEKLSLETLTEMREWSKEHKCGQEINPNKMIWSFKNEKQRNFFLMRWAGRKS